MHKNSATRGKQHTFNMLVSRRTYFKLSLAFDASLRVLKQTYAQPRGGTICHQTKSQKIQIKMDEFVADRSTQHGRTCLLLILKNSTFHFV